MNNSPLRSAADLEARVRELGILPFFHNRIAGFSVEEMSDPSLWFADGVDGPWEWKGPVIRSGEIAYGSFFNGKAVYMTLPRFAHLANWRRSILRVSDRMVNPLYEISEQTVLDVIEQCESVQSKELKRMFGLLGPRKRTAFDLPGSELPAAAKGSRSGMDAVLSRLQMATRIVIADFEYPLSKKGEPYGWGLARYTTPEALFGRDALTVDCSPAESLRRLSDHLHALCPAATPAQISRLLS